MSFILSIETATSVCSVALHEKGSLVYHASLFIDRSHAESLMEMVKHLLTITKVEAKKIAAIAVSQGPGSYTGLRIGASVSKGLCYGWGVPLISVGTLEAMADGMRSFVDANTLLCPNIDANRSAIYILMADSTGKIVRKTHVAFMHDKNYAKNLPTQPLLFFGSASIKCQQWFPNCTNGFVRFIANILPSAVDMGSLAFVKFQKQQWEAIDSYVPYYL